jgi:hypothetical protein
MASSDKPVVEQPPRGDGLPEINQRALNLRIRQQEVLAELGVAALKGTPFRNCWTRLSAP